MKMIETGITHPPPEIAEGVKRLVAGLSELQPNDLVYFEIQNGNIYWKTAPADNLIAEFPWIPKKEREK